MGEIQNLEDLIGFLLRRGRLILAAAVLGIALSAVFAKTRPDSYEATAAIQVEAAVAAWKNANPAALSGVADALRDEQVGVEAELRALEQSFLALAAERGQLAARADRRTTERRRLEDLDKQVAVLADQKSALVARRDKLGEDVARLPEIDRAPAAFGRERDRLRDSLDATTARLAEAKTDARLVERQQGERFARLDRARTSDYPVGSDGRKLFAAGALARLFVALALLKPLLRTSAQMERQLGLRPIVAIPPNDLGAPTARPPKGR